MNSLQKEKNFRSKKFLDLAKGEQCFINIPGICSRNPNDETVVACHSPDFERMHGKSGYTVKAHDIFSVPGCHKCHDFIDNRSHVEVSTTVKQQDWNRAHARWIVHCLQTEKIQVA